MKMSAHFTLDELLISENGQRLGIDNTPPDGVFLNLIQLANFLEDVRVLLGHPILISSGYRCPALNKAIGGAAKSHHMLGMAADFICPGFGSPLDVCQKIASSGLQYDQCIHEFGRWVHLGIDPAPRRENLTARRGVDGRTVYEIGHNQILSLAS